MKLNKWERKLHAMLQPEGRDVSSAAAVVVASTTLDVDFYSLQSCGITPLGLVFGKKSFEGQGYGTIGGEGSVDCEGCGMFPVQEGGVRNLYAVIPR